MFIFDTCLVYFDALDGLRAFFFCQEPGSSGRVWEEEPMYRLSSLCQGKAIIDYERSCTHQNSTEATNVIRPVMIINL